MPKNFKIIAFEGLDCSFKETNYNAFFNNVKKNWLGVQLYGESFPRYSEASSMFVNKWLGKDGTFDRSVLKQYPMAVDSFYAIDRMCYWYDKSNGPSIMETVKNNPYKFFTFIFDRYNFSNTIYNPIYTGVDIRDFTFDRDVYAIPLPDVIVWMRMKNFDVLKSLLAAKENKDAQELDTEFLYGVWKRSEEVIKSDIFEQLGIKLVVVDCLNDDDTIKSKEEIFEFIIKNVN